MAWAEEGYPAVTSSVVDGINPTTCWSTGQLQAQIEKCQAYGLNYQTYVYSIKSETGIISTCKRVECSQKQACPSEEALELASKKCSSAGLETTYYTDAAQCQQVYCASPKNTCPSKEDNLIRIKGCVVQGLSYSYSMDSDGCPVVSCLKNECTSSTSLADAEKKCHESKGKPYAYQDASGCNQIGCNYPSACTSTSALESKIKSCKSEGLSYETYVKDDGCKEVYCRGQVEKEKVSCEKRVSEDNCIQIKCTDGYYFNSCVQAKVCQAYECKTFKDAQGCMVKSCTDGSESITCPQKGNEVECKVITNDNGCEVKECSDGQRYEYCPVTYPECKTTTDESGCKYKVCVDPKTGEKTTSTSYCPEKESSKPVQCKVYTAEGSNVKVCDNGFKVVYEELTNCVATTSDGATKKCSIKNSPSVEYLVYVDNGYNEIECLANLEEQTTICTANMEKERGAANVTTKAPATVDNPAQSEKPSESFWTFLSRLFGGQ